MTLNMEQGARTGAPFSASAYQRRTPPERTPRIESYGAEVDVDNNGTVHCPVCLFDHAHLARPVQPYIADTRSYGWVMDVEGECGHGYRIVVRQYKGQVQIFTVPSNVALS